MDTFVRLGRLVISTIPFWLRIGHLLAVLIGVCLSSLWVGVPTATDRIAVTWTKPFLSDYFFREYELQIYWIMRTVSMLLIIIGWFVLAYATVGFVRLIGLVF